jgi:hypothetical protein
MEHHLYLNKEDMEEQKTYAKPIFLKFGKTWEQPEYKYNKSKGFISWGDKNDYPGQILSLYNEKGSNLHKAIINKKVKLIAGKGIQTVDAALEAFLKANESDIFLRKIAVDYEIFNAFAIEVLFDEEGLVEEINHVNIHKLRRGIKSEKINFNHFWYSTDWQKHTKAEHSPQFIREFNPRLRVGRQLLWFQDYNPSTDGVYPIPYYSNALNWVSLDWEISKFHLNQARQAWTPSAIINFATGVPSQEERDEYADELEAEFQGTDNAGKIMITYSAGQDEKPDYIPLEANDSDERFVTIAEGVKDNIAVAHEFPAQLVLQTPGKLGSSSERAELLEEVKISYVLPRQNQIKEQLTRIFELNGYGEFEIVEAEMIVTNNPTPNV